MFVGVENPSRVCYYFSERFGERAVNNAPRLGAAEEKPSSILNVDLSPQQVAHTIAKMLSEFGMPAFIVEPPPDTAIRP